MHSTYVSSTVLPFGTKGSLSFCFNDYSNLLNERFDGNPFAVSSSPCYSCCNCCCCASSSFPTTHRWPTNPILSGGLRQSVLIQCSPSRRLVVGGRDRYYSRVPAYGLDHGTHEFSSSFKSGNESIETRGKGRLRRVNIRERSCLGGVDDVEAVISLLSEEVSGQYLSGRVRNGSFMKRAETQKRGSCGRQCRRAVKKNDGLVDRDSMCDSKSSRSELRKEEFRGKDEERQEREERKDVLNREHRRERKASSSFSSYYSLSSADDIESDKEVQDEYCDFLGESSTGLTGLRSEKSRLDEQVVDEFELHRDGEQEESLGQSRTSRTRLEWDLRKKSEKKLTDTGETQMTRACDSDYSKAASFHKQFDNVKERASKDNLENERKTLFNQGRDQTSEQSEFSRNYQEGADRRRIIGSNVERTSVYQKKFSGKTENLTVGSDLVRERIDERYKTVSETTENNSLRRNTANFTAMSKIENVGTDGVQDLRQSEPRMKIQEEDTARTSVWKTGQQGHQVGDMTAKIEPRRSRQQFSEMSAIHASSLQSESRMKKHEESMVFLSGSATEAKEHRSHIDEKVQQGVQFREGSNDVTNLSVNVTNLSVIHGSNTDTVIKYHGTSENRMIDPGSELTSDIDKTRRTGDIDNKVEKNVAQPGLRSEVLRGTNVLNFHEKTSQQISSSRESLSGISEVKPQQIGLEDNLRRSQFPLMPPPSQSVAVGSFHVGSPGNTTKEVYGDTLESSSNASYMYSGERTAVFHQEPSVGDEKGVNYREPLNLIVPEDALGSARQLEESSSQFVGEFVEKARHEASTSVNQMQKTAYDAKLVHEGEEDKRESLSQYSFDKLKEQNPRISSENSGTKGPDDEIWDVTEPSVSEHQETEAPEGSQEVKNVLVRRTGRSLWSIIANVVQLRWGSHAETPKSSGRSGRKDSSPGSASSEAWFSGVEPDENTDENVKRGRNGLSTEATSSQLSEQGEVQAEVSETLESKDKRRQDEAGTSSTSAIIDSRSTLKGISSLPEEKILARIKDGKGFQTVDSSMELGEFSLPFPSSDRLGIDESLRTARADASLSSSMEQIGQPVNANLTEVSGSKGASAELKRRKLQRTEQVTRDRFDEWEEAYKRDSEQKKIDEMFMKEALLEAKKAADTWEVPVGAVLVKHGKIIARGYNLVEELRDSTAHAEMICIREASNQLRTWRLAETTLYVTLEPCPMCAGAILQARIDTLVWGAPNKLLGADGSWIRLFPSGEGAGNGSELTDKPAAPVHPFHPNMNIRRGMLASECAEAMQQFFQLRRRKKEKKPDPFPISNPQSKILNKMHDLFHVFCL